MQDLFRDRFRISDNERSGRSKLGVEMCASDWRPAAFLPDLRKTSRVTGKEFVCRFRCTVRSEEHTSELQSHLNLVCRLLLEKKKKRTSIIVNILSCNYVLRRSSVL